MAQLLPFRGFRYQGDIVGEITDVVAPPYDRIYPDVQKACYARSPFNIVRITKGFTEEGDDESRNVYTRAAETLHAWIAEGVLVRDDRPALYAYHQTYSFGGSRLTRKGIIGLGKLEPEKVHAHERTLKGPREDRLKLIRATEANFGHIFMLYSDPERSADKRIAAAIAGRTPDIEAEDADGNLHQVWAITDDATIRNVQAALSDKDLYIADGHHRYETAVNYMRECENAGWRPAAAESFDARMMTLFNVDEPGTSIRPIHRMVHGIAGFDSDALLANAQERFEVERVDGFDAMADAVEVGGKHTFGFVAQDVHAVLRLKDGQDLHQLVSSDRSEDFVNLDVAVLHAGILESLLGIDARALEEQTYVTYTVDAKKGAEAVAAGDEQALFYLNPTAADEVIRVADQGEKMPQKSTDFYPKLLTGLVLTTMEIDKT